jgi:hypothetical protein
MWETQPPRILRACPGLYGDYFIFLQVVIKQMITVWIGGITIVKTETLIGYKLSTGSARLAQSMQ